VPIWWGDSGPPYTDTVPSPFFLEKILATLLPAPLACCRVELEQRRMTPPSNFVLRIIVEEDPKLVRTLNANYAGAAADGGLEPAERDALHDSSADTTPASRGLGLAAYTRLRPDVPGYDIHEVDPIGWTGIGVT
jgi:hypothetical protein